eukprot:6835747-Pyramimonas_sp.AAC.1
MVFSTPHSAAPRSPPGVPPILRDRHFVAQLGVQHACGVAHVASQHRLDALPGGQGERGSDMPPPGHDSCHRRSRRDRLCEVVQSSQDPHDSLSPPRSRKQPRFRSIFPRKAFTILSRSQASFSCLYV